MEQGNILQEKTEDLSQARTALAASEQSGEATAAAQELAAKREVDRKDEWMVRLRTRTERRSSEPDAGC